MYYIYINIYIYLYICINIYIYIYNIYNIIYIYMYVYISTLHALYMKMSNYNLFKKSFFYLKSVIFRFVQKPS